MQFNADTVIYIVPAKIVEDFGVQVQGVGSKPLLIITDSSTDEAIGVYGDATVENANLIKTENGGIAEIVYQYFNSNGLEDFNNSCDLDLEADQLVQLVQGAIDEDVSDFIEESEMDCLIIGADYFRDESFLEGHLNSVGVWVSKNDSAEILFDSKSGEIQVDGETYNDWQQLASEKLVDSDNNYVACLK